MKDIIALLEELKQAGIELARHANGKDLSFRAPRGALTPQIKARIAAFKEDLISYLPETQSIDGIAIAQGNGPYQLSAAQTRLWLQEQFDGTPNNLAGAVRLRGSLDTDRLEQSLMGIVNRHAVFRTRFSSESDGQGMQQIEPSVDFKLERHDLSSQTDAHEDAYRIIKGLAHEKFDFTSGNLLKARTFKIGPEDHLLFINMPHIVADGVSLQIFDRELAQGYLGQSIDPAPLRYADYAQWECGQAPDATALQYWRTQLGDAPVVSLPCDSTLKDTTLYMSSECVLHLLDKQQSVRLKQFGAEHGATAFMTLLAAFALTVSRVTGEPDLTIATAVNHRAKPTLQSVIGFFLNILALRIDLRGSTTFGDLIQQARKICLEAYEHQALPFEQVVEQIKPERIESRNPLARIAFAVGDTPWMPGHTLKLPNLEISPVDFARGMLDFDLHLWVSENQDGLTGRLEYRSDLHSEGTAQNLLARFRTVLHQLLANLHAPLNRCDALSDKERDWLGSCLDSTLNTNPAHARKLPSVIDLWRDSVASQGANIALRYGQNALDYRTLDRYSDELAAVMLDCQLKPGEVVALHLQPGLPMAVAMLATLKCAAAYLPLEADLPDQRLSFMLADSHARLVISQSQLAASLLNGAALIGITTSGQPATNAKPPRHWPKPAAPDLAYVMYTSGSTGTPKGVRVPHQAIVRLVSNTNYIDIKANDRIGQLSNSAFDAFTFEIWGALLNGASVIGIDRNTALDPLQLGHRLASDQITIAFMTTALFNQIARLNPDALSGLRYLLFGGEQADVSLVRHYLARAEQGREPKRKLPEHLLHVYGPTENTTFSTYYPVKAIDDDALHLPIGKPISGTSALVLTADMTLALPGVTGELYLGGIGLADGYLDRADPNHDKFVEHPLKPGTRLYRTADMVRVNQEGDIEFIGRADNQIKLRGFRIELGEIEARLFETPGVTGGLVTTSGAGDDLKIVAYVASELSDKEIKRSLATRLPSYMVPSVIICLPSLPLNRNGKIDRSRLPTPDSTTTRAIIAPRNDTQARLASIWCELIECDTVSVEDNFFDIGGHSLLAARVTARVNQQFRVSAPVRSLFEHPTIDRYAHWLTQTLLTHTPGPNTQISLIDRTMPLHLSSAQERLWFLNQMNPDSPAYNISYELRITGCLSVASLESALTALIDRHESLRTRFVNIDGKPHQEICVSVNLALKQTDLRTIADSKRQATLEQDRVADSLTPFQTDHAPLLRVTLYQMDEREWVLGLCLHHIIADGWSLAVLRRDLTRLYEAALTNAAVDLPKLPIQYADYANWDRAMRHDHEPHLAYWKEQLQDLLPLRMPLDYARPAKPSFRGAAQRFLVDPATTASLRALCAQHGATLFMVLLSAFGILLQRYSRQNDFAVGSPIAHRNHIDTEDLIGFFVNTLVMRCRMNDEQSFVEHLTQVRSTTMAAYAHQDLPFERLVQELDPDRDPTANPLVQVIFALQNAPVSYQQTQGINVEPMPYLVATTRFDLEMHLWEQHADSNNPDVLEGILVYNTALFDPANTERMCRCFQELLRSICAQPLRPISQLNLLCDQDRALALQNSWPVTDYPRNLTIVDLFAQQVTNHRHKPALLLGDRNMSYEQLDHASHRLASELLRRGMTHEAPIVLALKPSFAYFICLLGVLKAGGCYVPVDPEEPASRLSEMLAGIKPWLTINQNLYQDWDERGLFGPNHQTHELLTAQEITADSLAYIMFTSGSTGIPKGVSIPHRAVVRLVKNTNFHPFSDDEIWLQAASLAFDASTLEIWGALLNGASLAIMPANRAAFAEIGTAVRRHQVTSLWLTAGLFHSLVDTDIAALRPVRRLIAGGDVLSVSHIQKALQALPELKITNGYGPTENTTFTCCHAIKAADIKGVSIPIGRPVANTSVYIVDQNLQIVPDGMPGELVTGGDGLARQYLDAPELNEHRFIKHPFIDDPDARLYRTGDLVRRNVAGEVEFIGRIDNQVKIRGFRVETGEIEQLLRRQADVEDVAVIVQGQSDSKQLLAYVVPALPDPAKARTTLSQEQVGDWESLFDGSLYQNLQDGSDPLFNIAGWKSSYTNHAIPAEQMRDWLDDFIDTVKRYQLDNVLEIGCGTGMVLFRLANLCASYVATDFSAQALAHIDRHLPDDTSVKLYHREAMDTSGFEQQQFDTIILNSVVQYFPDIDYLNQLIAKCLPLLKDGGRLIIGDIRNFALLRAFHAGVQLAQSETQIRLNQWRSAVDRALLEEDELVISPSFFTNLSHARISRIAFRMQRPAHDNELSKFRYSAIIEVGRDQTSQPCPELDVKTPAEVERWINQHRPESFIIRAIPNARVKLDVALALALENRFEQATSLSALVQQIRKQSDLGVDPDAWWRLAHQTGYQVDAGWTDDNHQGAYDVVFTINTNQTKSVGVPARPCQGPAANHPMRGKLARALGPKLREHCKAHLPDYMIPSQFVMLPAMPLTPSGKLDKRALQAPLRAQQAQHRQIVAAENDLERAITTIWGELLGLDEPSVTDNFFDLGGHSLLMVQACNRLKTRLGLDVTVLTMFQHPTIRSLAQALGQSNVSNGAPSISAEHISVATERAHKQRQRMQQQAARHRRQP